MKALDKKIRIIQWLKEYNESSRTKGYVIGLSGGVDSTCSASLAVEAIGKKNVYGVILPCTLDGQIARKEDIQDAERVAKHLGIEYQTVYLSAATDEVRKTLGFRIDSNSLIASNIKARLRMIALRAIADEKHYLVLGTTNRTEDVLGYFTKGGDGGSGVDIEPIAWCYKYEVRQIVQSYNFPEDLVNRVASAGLFDNQTDEDEIGVTYPQLDALFELLDSHEQNSSKRYDAERYIQKHFNLTETQLENIKKRIFSTEHKRNLPPTIKV